MSRPRAINWIFGNRETGAITIAQAPNPALWVFIGTVALRLVINTGTPRTAISIVGLAALAWWAVDEIIRGVNPWRRLLGALGVGFVVSGIIALVR